MRVISRSLTVVAAFTLVAGAGCATAGYSGGSGGGGRNLIAPEELEESNLRTLSAYEVVQRLRPRWLRPRSAGTAGQVEPAVFLNGASYGDLAALEAIRAADVAQIRYIEARDATNQFGTGFPGGIIDVETGR